MNSEPRNEMNCNPISFNLSQVESTNQIPVTNGVFTGQTGDVNVRSSNNDSPLIIETNEEFQDEHLKESNLILSQDSSLEHEPQPFHDGTKMEDAINYLEQVRYRFPNQPERYNQFLYIMKQVKTKKLEIPDAIKQVSTLFRGYPELTTVFGKFLPEGYSIEPQPSDPITVVELDDSDDDEIQIIATITRSPVASKSKKRPFPIPSEEPPNEIETNIPEKKKNVETESVVESRCWCMLAGDEFFNKLKSAIQSPKLYQNLLRCYSLYNKDLMPSHELMDLLKPFLKNFPELWTWIKDYVVHVDSIRKYLSCQENHRIEVGESSDGHHLVGIDFSICERLGASYCVLPRNNILPKCTGRSNSRLCREVLNDEWISFPSCAWSQNTPYSNIKRSHVEKSLDEIDDERYELEIVIEKNLSAMTSLEEVYKKLNKLNSKEAATFKLDNHLGGRSSIINRTAIKLIYGAMAEDMIQTLKNNPIGALPIILARMKLKDEEWREAQKKFNQKWKERSEDLYSEMN